MPRRRRKSDADAAADGLIAFMEVVPVWVGPILALVAYLLLRFLVPVLIGGASEPFQRVYGGLSQQLAPLGAGVVLFLWILAEIKKRGRRRLLDGQGDFSKIRGLSWQEFEQLVGEAYRRQGYSVREFGGGGADGGVDLVLRRDGQTTLVQCKQWKAWSVGVKVVRELYGVMTAEKASRGVLVSCGRFTRDAEAFAEGKPIDLVDGDALWLLVEGAQRGNRPVAPAPTAPVPLATAAIPPAAQRTTVQPVVEMISTPATPPCPECSAPMVLRTARRGDKAGSTFFGCSRFPGCRGTRPAAE
jgi:restriction system protein